MHRISTGFIPRLCTGLRMASFSSEAMRKSATAIYNIQNKDFKETHPDIMRQLDIESVLNKKIKHFDYFDKEFPKERRYCKSVDRESCRCPLIHEGAIIPTSSTQVMLCTQAALQHDVEVVKIAYSMDADIYSSMHPVVVEYIFQSCSRLRHKDLVIRILRNYDNPSSGMILEAIKCMFQCGEYEIVEILLSLCEKVDISVVMTEYIQRGMSEKFEQLLSEHPQTEITNTMKDSLVLARLINGNFDDAFEAFKIVEEPTHKTSTTIMQALRHVSLENTKYIYDKREIHHPAQAFFMIDSYCYFGYLDEALQLCDDLLKYINLTQSKSIKFYQLLASRVVTATLCGHGQIEEAIAMLKKWSKKNNNTLNAVIISAYRRERQFDEAVAYFHSLTRHFVTDAVYFAMLEVYCDMKDVAQARFMLRKLKEPTEKSFSTLMELFLTTGDHENATVAYHRVRKPCNVIVYSPKLGKEVKLSTLQLYNLVEQKNFLQVLDHLKVIPHEHIGEEEYSMALQGAMAAGLKQICKKIIQHSQSNENFYPSKNFKEAIKFIFKQK